MGGVSTSSHEFSVELLNITTDIIAECDDVKEFVDWFGDRAVPTIADGAYIQVAGMENKVGDIPPSLNIHGMKNELDVSRELGNTTVTIPVPPDGKIVLFNTVSRNIDINHVRNIGETVAEVLPRLQSNKIEAQRQDFMLLHNVAVQMVQASSRDEILESAVNAVDSMIDPAYSRIDLWETGEFEKYMSTSVLTELSSLPSEDSVPVRAYQENKRVLIRDVSTHDHEIGVENGAGSVIIAPIKGVGVYIAVKEDVDGFEVYHADIVRVMMSHAAQILRANEAKEEIRETNVELQEQKEHLAVLNRIIRHDIRNEMQYVLGMAGILKEKVSDEKRERVEGIESSARKVTEITTTVRALVEEALDENEDDTNPVSLNDNLTSEIESMKDANEDVVVEYDPPLNEVTVVADDMLDSVFRNLLTNAINHNDKETPEITVGTDVTSDTVTVSVADNGPGIPDDLKEDMFSKGMKGDGSSGTGMGMYLIKTLLDKYDAEITVEDNEPQGTVFYVTLQRHN